MARSYKWPPVVEAVVEFQVREPLDAAVLEKLKDKLTDQYPLPPQRNMEFGFQIGPDSARMHQQFQGYRLTSIDVSDVLLIGPNSIVNSRLAPYLGWESLIERVQQNWTVFKRVAGQREITRVGVRFINRIDIPNPGEQPINLDDYLNVSPRLPMHSSSPLTGFAVNFSTLLGTEKIRLVVNVGSDNNVLVRVNSFLLDIDLSKDQELPQREEDLWPFVEKFRNLKNSVFESCITNRTREVFGT